VRGLPGIGSTFHHFRVNDQELALYSPDYTTTRLMRLPSCEDIGGEEPNSWGFCPAEYYEAAAVDMPRAPRVPRDRAATRSAGAERPFTS
jgi:hypothetical protein